jgi:hypothetical protein
VREKNCNSALFLAGDCDDDDDIAAAAIEGTTKGRGRHFGDLWHDFYLLIDVSLCINFHKLTFIFSPSSPHMFA